MKIAIPTNDGLTLSPDFGQAKGFLVLTLELGKITREEMRWNKLSEVLCSPEGFLNHLHDCRAVLVSAIGPTYKGLLERQETEIVRTKESIITNAYLNYRETILRKDSNTCCCP